MKCALDQLDTRGLRVDLPGSQVIALRSSARLRGVVENTAQRLMLHDVAAETVEVAALRLLLGRLVLSSTGDATLTALGLSVDRSADELVLSATFASITAADVEVVIDDVRVRGRVTLTVAALAVSGDEGSLSASRVEIADFVLRIGALEITAEQLVGSGVKLGWGAAGFWLHATAFEGPALGMQTGDVRLTAGALAVDAFRLEGKALTVGRAALGSGQVAVGLRRSAESVSGTDDVPALPDPAAPPLFDLATLDALSGQLDVDVAVDLTVPIIGRRKATHRLRVAIDRGTLDYRALEHNLAKLEDALLDFSVRDNALVLERVNPLFPARGHGKPVVLWDVAGADLELAQRERVRLSVLPRARLATDAAESGAPPSKKSRGIALRELGLLRINARLALAAPAGLLAGQVRLERVGALTLGGNVFHEPGGCREGDVLGELTDFAGSLHALALGTTRLTARSVTAASLAPLEVAFADVQPTRLDVSLQHVRLDGVAIAF